MLRSKDLSGNQIAIFNSILSARLICILDFIFAETTLTERPVWLTGCWPTTDPCGGLPSRSRILVFSRTLIARRQENLISPAFDNVYSVPVQAA
jgi:hypothetical protein